MFRGHWWMQRFAPPDSRRLKRRDVVSWTLVHQLMPKVRRNGLRSNDRFRSKHESAALHGYRRNIVRQQHEPLTGYAFEGSHRFHLHEQRSWTRSRDVAGIAASGALGTVRHERDVDGSKAFWPARRPGLDAYGTCCTVDDIAFPKPSFGRNALHLRVQRTSYSPMRSALTSARDRSVRHRARKRRSAYRGSRGTRQDRVSSDEARLQMTQCRVWRRTCRAHTGTRDTSQESRLHPRKARESQLAPVHEVRRRYRGAAKSGRARWPQHRSTADVGAGCAGGTGVYHSAGNSEKRKRQAQRGHDDDAWMRSNRKNRER